jgi:pyruvate/2-oxoglutarate dehydrogenase complex dihydrolipoamide acyltransferase (E2) component
MVNPVEVPRLNNNDDEVKVTLLMVLPGDRVSAGQDMAEVETEKASFVVEAERDGYVLSLCASEGDVVDVGSVLLWMGDEATERAPEKSDSTPEEAREAGGTPVATAKAKLLMEAHGVNPADVPHRGERIRVGDVEAILAASEAAHDRGAVSSAPARELPAPARASGPTAGGNLEPLSSNDRGMMRSVLWHRDEAAAAYLELEYDQEEWDAHAAAYAEQKRLLSSPLLPLMMHRLARIAASHPKLNTTILDRKRFVYDKVNLGFTILSGETLYLAVIPDAGGLEEQEMVKAFNRLHRRAAGHKLSPDELQGATVGFSSMARWPVRRHIPILPPFVSLMCAHAAPPDGPSIMGASYDHRVLSGGDVQAILNQLIKPTTE